jgi:exo-beta-1,3-glucanase (GH17 family)/cellulose synthase/poly-beta-1,6-N-acetylglucosamine synthase-like glycosyltransferase
MRNLIAAAGMAAAIHGAAWYVAHEAAAPPDLRGYLQSLSYSPYRPGQDPKGKSQPTPEQIEQDLTLLSNVAKSIRTYTAAGVVGQIPALAAKHGLNVSVGAWATRDEARNLREVREALQIARTNLNVRSIIVGNEAILRKELTPDELIGLLRFARKRSRVPVSTGEVWNEWLANPRLANEVDFIAAHILPYWEGVPNDAVVDYALRRYEDLKRAFPGKKIVIAEFGWPSQGYNFKHAVPDLLAQAEIVRRFAAEAEKRGIEYNVVEAFDQPWKWREGSVGQYWGLFDAQRKAKFPFIGGVEERNGGIVAGLALALGLLLAVLGLARRRPPMAEAVLYALATNAVGAGLVLGAAYPFTHYQSAGSAVMWAVGFALMIPLSAITLAKAHEIGAVLFGRRPERLYDPARQPRPADFRPKVSIHVPACREPPEMLIETLNNIAALDYPNFEAVVVVNNTPEERFWRPVEERCRALGPRFKFVNIPKLAGFKAGALNAALERTAPDAEIVGLLDADYKVDRDWLKDLVPAFRDPAVGLVQAPQDHREEPGSAFRSAMNAEYKGFFDIGMVQRNEDDAIIQHGTMCLVRRSALDRLGGWSTATIVEDTEFGLRLLEAGHRSLYTNRRYGFGVVPDTFKAYQVQRHRWAYGAVQIIRRHWLHMLPGAKTLTAGQKRHFIVGWTCWLADALGALAAILNLLWVPAILFVGVLIPTVALTVPVAAAFAVNVLHCALLYPARVRVPLLRIPGAAISAMSLQLTVAKAVLAGLIRPTQPFRRTDKGGNAKPGGAGSARAETVLGALLAAAAAVLVLTNTEAITEINLFAATLAVQSVPMLAATAMRLLEQVDGWRLERAEARAEALAHREAAAALAGSARTAPEPVRAALAEGASSLAELAAEPRPLPAAMATMASAAALAQQMAPLPPTGA